MILYRYSKAEAAKEELLKDYPDADKVSTYAKEALNWAVSEGLINGTGESDGRTYLQPQAGATRAQIAVILMRFLQNN